MPATDEAFRIVQRTQMRSDLEMDVRSLYLWAVTSISSGDPDSDESANRSKRGENNEKPDYSAADVGLAGHGRIENDTVVVEPGHRITLGAYFNAFPAGYWRRWTELRAVRLTTVARGTGTIQVYRSTARGHVLRVTSETIDSAEPVTHTFDLSLDPFIDGGWYWFDIEGGDGELTLVEGHWGFETDKTAQGRLSIGITTFNRPTFCVDQLLALGGEPSVLEIIDKVYVVDQGTQLVSDSPDYPRAAELLGDKLQVIRQPNLGGSGGFSRAMYETVKAHDSDYVLLLDDDVVCELEGIKRAVAFADLCTSPTLVGGHMFSLYDRTVMHAYGETIAPWRWFWGPAPATRESHDFARVPLRSSKWLHRRIDVDYNGWWMCLIPTRVVEEIGLSLPMFIKWDDSEFGIRAKEAGYRTVSLPGAAVWHVPWTEKDDTLDWQAYFHERNRIVSALLHSPYPRGGRLVQESMENHVKRLVAMQYSTGEVIMLALRDVLDGPERMHSDIQTRLADVRALRLKYADAQPHADLDEFPEPRLEKPRKRGKGVPNPTTRRGKLQLAAAGLVRQLRTPRKFAERHPEALVPHLDQKWYRLAHFDSAIVSAADGGSAAWHRRDREEFFDQLRRSSALHSRLLAEWPSLAKRYREALVDITSPEAWEKTFGISGAGISEAGTSGGEIAEGGTPGE
ncbi:MAG: glycosyltransferase [Nocardioidaceae bacterium]